MSTRIGRLCASVAMIAAPALALAGCAGGTAKARVQSSPQGLSAYAIPASTWLTKGEKEILDHLPKLDDTRFRFSNRTPTEAKSLDAQRYVFVVTDGTSHGYLEKELVESTQVHEIRIELPR